LLNVFGRIATSWWGDPFLTFSRLALSFVLSGWMLTNSTSFPQNILRVSYGPQN